MIKYNSAVFMFKYMNKKLPSSFNEMFLPLTEPNRTKSYQLELVNKKYLENFPKVLLPKIWNLIPLNIKSMNTLTNFKYILKTNLLSEYKNFRCVTINCYACSTNLII